MRLSANKRKDAESFVDGRDGNISTQQPARQQKRQFEGWRVGFSLVYWLLALPISLWLAASIIAPHLGSEPAVDTAPAERRSRSGLSSRSVLPQRAP